LLVRRVDLAREIDHERRLLRDETREVIRFRADGDAETPHSVAAPTKIANFIMMNFSLTQTMRVVTLSCTDLTIASSTAGFLQKPISALAGSGPLRHSG